VIAPRNRGADGGPALSATRQVLPRLEAYTGLPYPYRKLDHLAMPDGAFSATENPGLIAYRQDSLLVPPDQATPARLRALRALQAHELAHQWFGNLVTQAAWDDVWLSEGFATWLSARVMDTEEPPARRRLRAVAARERIMEADAGERAMPVRRALNSRRQMAGVYNRFVYQKGAAVLLMLEGWLGDDRFRDGVRAYLQRHRFAAATTADLATALRQASGADPAAVMSSFLNQAGIPSLRVRTACDAGAAPRLVVEQGGPARRWSVPVCWTGDAAARACAVVDQPRQEIELNGSSGCPAWLFPNAGGTGYYRIEWTPKQLATLEPGALAAGERLTLVYDLRALKRAGRLEATGAKLLARLADDAEPDIARAAREALGKVNSAGTPNP
jgi:alanyl aminopeptidase